MQRALLVLVVGAVLLMTTAAPATASRSWRWDECRFRNYSGGPSFNHDEVELLVRCAVSHYPVSGGDAKALAVMYCESGGGPYAYNPAGYYGLFQFAAGTFNGTYDRWSAQWRRWDVQPNWFNARSNALLAIHKAHSDGWGAWSCA